MFTPQYPGYLETMFKVAVQLSESHISMQMSLKLVEMSHKLMLMPPKVAANHVFFARKSCERTQ